MYDVCLFALHTGYVIITVIIDVIIFIDLFSHSKRTECIRLTIDQQDT